jgi:hypothetical protein
MEIPMYKHGMNTVASVFLGLALPVVAGERQLGPPVRLTPSEVVVSVDQDALDRQYQALSSMPSVKASYSNLGLISLIEGHTGIVLSNQMRASKRGDAGAEVLDKFRDLLLARGEETLVVRLNTASPTRARVVKLDQSIRGIPVLHGVVSVTIDEATGIVRSMGAYFLPDHGLPRQPKLSSAKATALVTEMLETQGIAKPGTVEASNAPTLAYHGIFPNSKRARLVWAVTAHYVSVDTGDSSDGIYWIDAIDGEYVGTEPSSVAALNRTVYTANNQAASESSFPDGLIKLFDEGGSSSDQLAMNAYNNADKAY